jgi:hypothetical protein
MTRMSGNAHVGQSQGSFRDHARNFQAIEVLRFQVSNNLLDRLTGDFGIVGALHHPPLFPLAQPNLL